LREVENLQLEPKNKNFIAIFILNTQMCLKSCLKIIVCSNFQS